MTLSASLTVPDQAAALDFESVSLRDDVVRIRGGRPTRAYLGYTSILIDAVASVAPGLPPKALAVNVALMVIAIRPYLIRRP